MLAPLFVVMPLALGSAAMAEAPPAMLLRATEVIE